MSSTMFRRKSCRKSFLQWQATLEHYPDWWLIRFLPDDSVWFNPATRTAMGMMHSTFTWSQAMKSAHIDEVHKIEDAYSLALKTMKPQLLTFRLKTAPDQLEEIGNVITPWVCNGCAQKCAMCITLISPLTDADLSEVASTDRELA